MYVYLIRHAHAGSRVDGTRDLYRPLSDKGQLRAGELASMLAGKPITRILSSPATRCTQTVGPLAAATGIEVEEFRELWEGSGIDDVLLLMEQHTTGDLVVCSHGDIIPELIDWLGNSGTEVRGHGCEKGSVWILERVKNDWVSAHRVKKKATSIA
jgi:phosphohistidine phosphatase SixA